MVYYCYKYAFHLVTAGSDLDDLQIDCDLHYLICPKCDIERSIYIYIYNPGITCAREWLATIDNRSCNRRRGDCRQASTIIILYMLSFDGIIDPTAVLFIFIPYYYDITGGACDVSNQNLRCTQKPIYTPIFTHHVRS